MFNASSTEPSNLQFESDQVRSFQLKMHINSILSLLAGTLGAYLIIFKAKKTMGAYKWFLLNIVLTSLLFDVYITVFMAPFQLIPAIGYCVTGLFQHFGLLWGAAIPFIFMMELLGLIGAAVINAAIYRLAAIYNVQGRMTAPRTVSALAVIEIFFALPTMVLATFIAVQITQDQPKVMADVFVKYPKLETFVQSQELCIFASLSSNYPIMEWVMVSAIFELCGCVIIGVTIWTISIMNLKKRKRL